MTTVVHPLSADQLAKVANESGCDAVFVDALAQELTDGRRTSDWFVDIANRYQVSPATVRMTAEAIDAPLIFESAPNERTTPMPTPTTRAETLANVAKIHGAGRPTVAAIERLLGVSESDATVMARRLVGDATPAPTTVDVRRTERAQLFADAVDAAESKPIETASLSDLENLAASRAWF